MDFSMLRKARKAAGITQKDLANALGINRATISKYESGTIEPSISQLKQIAEILQISWFDLLPEHERGTYMLANVIANGLGTDTGNDTAEFDEESELSYQSLSLIRVGDAFELLNEDGISEAVKRVEELTEIPKYQKAEDTTDANQDKQS